MESMEWKSHSEVSPATRAVAMGLNGAAVHFDKSFYNSKTNPKPASGPTVAILCSTKKERYIGLHRTEYRSRYLELEKQLYRFRVVA
jgi:hypothetical protein